MKRSELRKIIKEEIIKIKKPANEGFVTNIISKIVSLVLAGQGRQINNLIDPIGRREVIKASNEFKKSVENLRNVLNSPEVKAQLKKSGVNPEDFPWYK